MSSKVPDSPIPTVETIKFEGGKLEAIRRGEQRWVCIKPLCEALGLDYSGQQQRLKRLPWAVVGIMPATGADGKRYQMTCIPADQLAM